MNILVLGEKGMLAHVVGEYLEDKHDVDRVSLRYEDVRNIEFRPYEVVINCVGVLVKESEIRKDRATYFNTFVPNFLAKNVPGKVIHVSTDCVYDDNFYGRTKALVEIDNSKDVTLRTSIIGPELNPRGTGLFNWFMQQEGEIEGYTKAMWNGITTLQFAKCIDEVINQNLSGIYNLTMDVAISKQRLLSLLAKRFNKRLNIVPVNKGKDRSLVSGNSIKLPDYETQLKEMKEWIDERPETYSHYLCK